MFDVVALGELLVDFTPVEARSFFANPGGAPVNVLAAAAKLGLSTNFIGLVGEDDFGHMLQKDLEKAGVGTAGLHFTTKAFTTLAFVQLNEEGDRSFAFARKPGADMLLQEEDVDFSLIDKTKVFHFGGLSLSDEPARTTTLKAAGYAKQKGKIVSYDPNLRPLLWKTLDEARDVLALGFAYADILKLSEEELEFLTGESDLQKGSRLLLEKGISIVFITLGGKGCYFATKEAAGLVPGYKLETVDTTGAGDAFMGGAISWILQTGKPIGELCSQKEMQEMVAFANAVGALSTTKKGAIPAMPSKEEVLACIKNSNN